MTHDRCTIDGCERDHLARGWCQRHYNRWRTTGDPLRTLIAPPGEPMAYFLAHVDDDIDACVLWPYGQGSGGYGAVHNDGRKTGVHVLSCERHHGPKPDGHQVRHSCRNRHCFNPRHVRWGTHTENMRDKRRDGTHGSGERNGRAILTEVAVAEIRRVYQTGSVSHQQLADRYGVSKRAIGRVLNHRTWTETV